MFGKEDIRKAVIFILTLFCSGLSSCFYWSSKYTVAIFVARTGISISDGRVVANYAAFVLKISKRNRLD